MAKKPLWQMALFLKSPNSDNKLAFIVLMAFQEGGGWSGFVLSAEQACELCWIGV